MMPACAAELVLALSIAGALIPQPGSIPKDKGTLSAEQTARFTQGVEALKQGRLEAADQAFRDVLRSGGDLGFVHHNLGVVLDQRGRHAAALAEFRAAIRLDPSYGPSHLLAGTSLLALGRAREAIRYLHRAEQLLPSEVLVPARLAEAHERIGDVPRMTDALRRTRTLAPHNPEYAYRLGRAYLTLGQWSLERLRATNPRSPRLQQVLARSYIEGGQTAQAIDALRAALALEPTLPEVHLALAELYFGNRQLDLAAAEVASELALQPNGRAALQLKAQIEQARSQNEVR
jgi:predicted Zn-dependent protease